MLFEKRSLTYWESEIKKSNKQYSGGNITTISKFFKANKGAWWMPRV